MLCAHCGSETARDPCAACGGDARLAGRYELIRAIGHGASGVMWLARDPAGRSVAIKELRITTDPKATELIAREARVLSELSHPQIPAYIEDFDAGGGRHRTHCVVQEYVEGRTLGAVLKDERHDLAAARRMLEELLEPLAYLHGLSPPVVHRDLKPENILVRPDGTLVIVDFGSVRDAWKGTFGGSTVAGTFAYMAPEQFGGDASPASDVYALGVLLVEMLSRRDPAALRDRNQRFAWADHVRVPPRWQALLASMLEPDPTRRAPNAAAVREALGSLDHDFMSARTATRELVVVEPDEVPRWRFQGEDRFVAAAGTFAVFAVGAAVVATMNQDAVIGPRERDVTLVHALVWWDAAVRQCLEEGPPPTGPILVEPNGDLRLAAEEGCFAVAIADISVNSHAGEAWSVDVGLPWTEERKGASIARAPSDAPRARVTFDVQKEPVYVDGAAFAMLAEKAGQYVVDMPAGAYRSASLPRWWDPWLRSARQDTFTVDPDSTCIFRWDGTWNGTCVADPPGM